LKNNFNEQAIISFEKLVQLVKILRSEDGCDWDKIQTSDSLIPYFIEEVYELVDSIDKKDYKNTKEELGDVMLHIVLQAQIAREDKKFTIIDSLDNLNKKLVHRHPHVFGDKKADASFEAKQNWEAMKHKEKKRKSRLDGVPPTLPALTRSHRLQQKAAYAGFDWDNINDVWRKLYEELEELKIAYDIGSKDAIEEEVGDILFSIVNLARHLDIHAEDILRRSNKKFVKRFKKVEQELESQGKTMEESSLEDMDKIWEKIKEKA